MALFSECMLLCAQRVLDRADIVRDRDFSPIDRSSYSEAMRRTILLLLFCVALTTAIVGQSHRSTAATKETKTRNSSEEEGTLVVLVNWGDLNNTAATNVWIEAHGFVPKYHSERSFALKFSQPGQYKASLPAAVYDVFVSEGTSLPTCKRVLITPGQKETWTLNLEMDKVYTEK
jgi:hypothetical protein